jgi:hypothetical protein
MLKELLILLICFCSAASINAQQNRIKAAAVILPGGSPYIIGTLGYERLDKSLTASWQFLINIAGGELAIDAGDEMRRWGTVERIFYKQTKKEKLTWSYSFFVEMGQRIKQAGFVKSPPEKIYQERKTIEMCPGVGVGLQYKIKKRWRIEAIVGPKFIFAIGDKYYYNSITRITFKEQSNSIGGGIRFNGLLSYQF